MWFSNLLEHSKNQILTNEFIDSLGVLSQSRRKKYRVTLGKVSRELGEFTDVDKKKLKEYIIKKNESPLSEHTKRDYKIVLKKFFGRLRDHEFVSWIKVGIVKFCQRPLGYNKYSYRGIGHYDVQHTSLVRELGATDLLSFDRGFLGLELVQSFKEIRFEVQRN